MEEEKIEKATPVLAQNGTPNDLEDQDYEDQGYEDLSNNDSQDGDEEIATWGYSQKEIDLTSELLGLRSELEDKIKSLGLTCYFTDGEVKKVILMGEGYALQEFAAYVNTVKKLTEKNSFQNLTLGQYTQKEVPLRSSFRHFKPLIDQVAEKLELVIEYDKTKLTVHGYDRRIRDLMAFLFEKETEYGEGQYIDQEINISTFHRVQKMQIEVKVAELGLKSEFGYDMISVGGPRKLIDQLVLYLMELETMAKQALFPYHWDFTDSKPLSLVDVYKNTAEFKLVEEPFMKGLPHAKILSIQRIQNKYLMDQFIMVINKRMEERPNEQINRKLLFHGTRENPPEKIYANFDTGFDLQYARYGSYGKGIYFANNSTYSDGYAFHSKQGTKKMFMADVFIGKAHSGSVVNQVKAPQGYDSIEATGAGFYIVYHNFYSYPLYLIEYK